VNYENFIPAVSSAFNTGCVASCSVTSCSCTAASFYWSSSTDAIFPSSAWGVRFGFGDVIGDDKSNNFFVRAVRGGL
jgi:hypothetical protein